MTRTRVVISWLICVDLYQSLSGRELGPLIINPLENQLPDQTVQRYPYLGGVMDMSSESYAFCTSTLTGSNELISAAHCFMNKTALNFMANRIAMLSCLGNYVGCSKVALGQSNLISFDYFYEDDSDDADAPVKVKILDIYLHENYYDLNEKFYVDDIAIIIMEAAVTFNNYTNNAILAPKEYQLSEGQQGTILGWGKTNVSANTGTVELNFANVTILDHAHCQNMLNDLNFTAQLPPAIICSFGGNENGSSPCKGDSGGPLVCEPDRTLCGVLSGSDECKPEIPALYNSISFHDDWISNTRKRQRISVDLWHFKALESNGRELTSLELLSRLSVNKEFMDHFIIALGQVPLQNFVFEMDGIDEDNWNSIRRKYLFRVRNAHVLECHSNSSQVITQGKAIIPCFPEDKWQTFYFASFIRSKKNRKQVSEVLKKFAEEAKLAIRSGHRIRVTSSYQNTVGIYIAIDVMETIVNATLTLRNYYNAGGFDISAQICTEKSAICCDIFFGEDLNPGTTTTKEPKKCRGFQIDSQVQKLFVVLKSSDGNQFMAESLEIVLSDRSVHNIDFSEEWIAYNSSKYVISLKNESDSAPVMDEVPHEYDLSSISTYSNEVFPKMENSPTEFYFKVKSEGGGFITSREFLKRIMHQNYFTQGFIHALKQARFEEFILTFKKVHKNELHDFDYNFKIEKQDILYPICEDDASHQHYKTAKDGLDTLVVPCINDKVDEWKKFNLATFVKFGSETQVMSFIKKMAAIVHDYIESGNRMYTISSSHENIPGIYLMPQFGVSNHAMSGTTVMFSLDDIILIAGGSYHQIYSNEVETINNAGPLRALADLPEKVAHGVGGIQSNHIIICGGTMNILSVGSEVKKCYILSEDGSSWAHLSYLRQARIYSSGVNVNNVFWISGGYVPPFEALKTTEIIHVDGTSTAGPSLIEPLYGHCSIVADGKVFIIGGYNGTSWTDSTRIHDSNDLTFAKLGPRLNKRRSSHGCCLVSSAQHEGRQIIIVVGGYNANSSVEIIDFTVPGSTWQKTRDLPEDMPDKPGLHPTSSGDGIIIVYEESVYKMTISNSGFSYKKLDLTLKYPRSGFASMTIPFDVAQNWN